MPRVEFCCRSGGNNLNAGSLDGTNEPSASPLAVYAGGDWNSGTSIYTAPVGADLTEAIVGRFISIYHDGDTVPVSGQWQVSRITAVNAGTRQITVSGRFSFGASAVVTGTGNRSARISGAWAGPSGSVRFPFTSGYGSFGYSALLATATSGIRINIRNDQTYSITANLFYSDATGVNAEIRGYASTYGDSGRALIQGPSTGAAFNVMTLGVNSQLKNLILDCNGGTGNASGIVFDGNSREITVKNVVVRNMRGWGINGGATAAAVEGCEIHNCNTSGTASQGGINCTGLRLQNVISHDNTGWGFYVRAGGVVLDCIADTNSSVGFYCETNYGIGLVQGCDSYGNGSHGFVFDNVGNGGVYNFKNCNSIINAGWGFIINTNAASLRVDIRGFGTFGNTSGAMSIPSAVDVFSENLITYASSPYVAPSSGDFRLSLAAAKQSGSSYFVQTASGYSGTVSYPDIGAVQAIDGGSARPQHPMTQQVIQ